MSSSMSMVLSLTWMIMMLMMMMMQGCRSCIESERQGLLELKAFLLSVSMIYILTFFEDGRRLVIVLVVVGNESSVTSTSNAWSDSHLDPYIPLLILFLYSTWPCCILLRSFEVLTCRWAAWEACSIKNKVLYYIFLHSFLLPILALAV